MIDLIRAIHRVKDGARFVDDVVVAALVPDDRPAVVKVSGIVQAADDQLAGFVHKAPALGQYAGVKIPDPAQAIVEVVDIPSIGDGKIDLTHLVSVDI